MLVETLTGNLRVSWFLYLKIIHVIINFYFEILAAATIYLKLLFLCLYLFGDMPVLFLKNLEK